MTVKPRVFPHWRKQPGKQSAHFFLYSHQEGLGQFSCCGGRNSKSSDDVLYYLPPGQERCPRCERSYEKLRERGPVKK